MAAAAVIAVAIGDRGVILLTMTAIVTMLVVVVSVEVVVVGRAVEMMAEASIKQTMPWCIGGYMGQ